MQALCRAELQPQKPGVYLGGRRHGTEPSSVSPQALQVVVRPGFGVEEVDDDVAEVQQHPLAILPALTPERLAVQRSERLLHLVGEGDHMAARGAGGDDEDVGDDQKLGDIEQGDANALLVDDG